MIEGMYEVRWHGRGGQGVVTASEILAHTAMKEGKYLQSFPDFGPERMGAPVKAYTRIDNKPITVHSQVYEPNAVIVLDSTLLEQINVAEGLKRDGLLIVNTNLSKEKIKEITNFQGKIFVIDATKIALETIGKPLVNVCGVAALSKITGIIQKENILATIRDVLGIKFSDKIPTGGEEDVYSPNNEVE